MVSNPSARASFYRHAWVGVASVVGLAGGLVAWAALTNVSGAVIASGIVTVDGGVKQVQHQEGGIVREILVDDDDLVSAGQVLVRLDGTAIAASLGVINAQLADALALQARLKAESLGHLTLSSVDDPLTGSSSFAALLDAQAKLLHIRAATRTSLSARLRDQVDQINEQVNGLEQQREAASIQLRILGAEQQGLDELLASGLVEVSRVNAIKREVARLTGESGRIIAEVGAARAAISERELQITQVAEEFLAEVLGQLQLVDQRVRELQQQRIAAEDRLNRLEIRAPQAGLIHEAALRTVGGIIAPGEVLMQVVPQDRELTIEARVQPADIDQLKLGQLVVLRLAALDARTTPELSAEVSGMSPDLSVDPATGLTFYTVRVHIPQSELGRLPAGQHLVPGMPVDVFVQTGDRTVLSYLIAPLEGQLHLAFRER